MSAYFSSELLKAVDGWQAGSVGKARKAKKIKAILAKTPLDSELTECDVACFRRSVLVKAAITNLYFKFVVGEETSSWTTRYAVAQGFKGGPEKAPAGGDAAPAVVFRHMPKTTEVILNLERLHAHEEFHPSVRYWTEQGLDFSKGIKLYANTQHEVILDVDEVPHNEVFAFGGDATEKIQKRGVTDLPLIGSADPDTDAVERDFSDHGLPTRRWIKGDGVWAIYKNWFEKADAKLVQLLGPPPSPG